jgi:malonyl-CoA O-methyltransferase
MQPFDKKIIENNFSKKAKNYEDFAFLQKEMANKLVDLCANFLPSAQKIIDLGSGSSFVAKQVLTINKNAEILEVDISKNMLELWLERPKNVKILNCDIENLALPKSEKFDVVFSSYALHWLNNFEKSFKSFCEILAPNGYLAICLPVFGSLQELKNLDLFFLNNFPKIELIEKILRENKLIKICQNCEINQEEFVSAIAALKHLKNFGGNYNSKKKLNKNDLKKIHDFYLKNSSKQFRNFAISWRSAIFIYQKPAND